MTRNGRKMTISKSCTFLNRTDFITSIDLTSIKSDNITFKAEFIKWYKL